MDHTDYPRFYRGITIGLIISIAMWTLIGFALGVLLGPWIAGWRW